MLLHMRGPSKQIARRRRAACAVAPLQLPSQLLLFLPVRRALRCAPLQLLLQSPLRRRQHRRCFRRCAVVIASCAVAVALASPVRRRRCVVGSAANGPAAKYDIE